MDENQDKWPIPKFHFSVQWDGATISCQEVTGLKFTTDVIEYRYGDDKTFIKKKIPGLKKFENITLKKGVFQNDLRFYDAWKDVQANKERRKEMIVQLLDEEHNPVMTWTVAKAFVLTLGSPDFNSTSNEIAIETIEIGHEGIELQQEA
jgi:phage tail-like protein